MIKLKTLVSTVILGILLYPSVWADHLKGKSKAEKDGYLKARLVDIPAGFKKIQISPATTVKSLKREIIDNKKYKIDEVIKLLEDKTWTGLFNRLEKRF